MIIKQDKCSRCKKVITNNNFGDSIEAEEVLVCNGCADEHKQYIITELDKFRHSKEFDDKLALRNKILWASEQLGNCFDNADKSVQESVSDYMYKNVFDLQLYIIELELICVEGLLSEGEFGLPIKDNPELQTLRKELLEENKRIVSYLKK